MPGHPVPVKNDVKQYFIRMWGDVESGCKWRGYKIRTIDDDVKAGDVVILGEDDLEPPHINEKKRKGVPPM